MLLTKDDCKMRWEMFQVFGFGATYIRGMTVTIFLVNWLDPFHIDGLMQDCSNSIANALELLQSCAKPSIYDLWAHHPNLVKVCIAYACKISIMMMSSNGNSFHITGPFNCGESTGHQRIPLTKDSDAELWCFLICAWTNASANNWDRRRWFEMPSWISIPITNYVTINQHINHFMYNCSHSITHAVELLQSYTKPSMLYPN